MTAPGPQSESLVEAAQGAPAELPRVFVENPGVGVDEKPRRGLSRLGQDLPDGRVILDHGPRHAGVEDSESRAEHPGAHGHHAGRAQEDQLRLFQDLDRRRPQGAPIDHGGVDQ